VNPNYPLVAERAGHRCEYCHAPEAIFNVPFKVDYIVPLNTSLQLVAWAQWVALGLFPFHKCLPLKESHAIICLSLARDKKLDHPHVQGDCPMPELTLMLQQQEKGRCLLDKALSSSRLLQSVDEALIAAYVSDPAAPRQSPIHVSGKPLSTVIVEQRAGR
jgi:hypothetical protein